MLAPAFLLALPRGNVVVEALASGPPPMDGGVHGDMPAPDYSRIPEEMLPNPGETAPLADSQHAPQGMAAPHAAASAMHGPLAQTVVTAPAGQAMTDAAPAGQMPAPDFLAIPAGKPHPYLPRPYRLVAPGPEPSLSSRARPRPLP